jgi:LPXTG-motif cell wall-anchored protein
VLDLKGVRLEAGKIYDVFAVGELASIKVETAVTTPPAAPAALPRTGGESSIALIALVAAATLIGAGLVLRRRLA